ncbi:MAG TPA: metallophosphoesterase [Candidatus Acidoferrum sp.]|nr:metallophosphoesterase [Candidatus Acidoferrum sp.]
MIGQKAKRWVRSYWNLLRLAGIAALPALVALGGCSDTARPSAIERRVDPFPSPASPDGKTFTLVGAGDIASCEEPEGARATALLLEKIPGTIFAAGDLAYEKGSVREFEDCYDPTWGEFKGRTRPAPGNHEYADPIAKGYFAYWGTQAGPAGKGYYSYELGSWHIVVLNTNCKTPSVGGCVEGSPEESWLKADLKAEEAEHPDACVLAYGHHPKFSSGIFPSHAMHPELAPLWEDLYEAHAAVVLAGHEHSYERFAPQDPGGNADPVNGIREFVVGTGGRSHDPLGFARPNSEVRNSDTYGVLKLTLSAGHYTWQFIPEAGKTFTDSGAGTCRGIKSVKN